MASPLVLVLVITPLTTVTVLQVSDRVRDNQLQSVETTPELEARVLGQWSGGKQEVVRTLSSHEGLIPVSDNRTQATLVSGLDTLSSETASLSVVERSPDTYSNGTDEPNVASTDTRLVGRALSATDIDWKPTVGCNFDDTDDGTLVTIQLPTLDPA